MTRGAEPRLDAPSLPPPTLLERYRPEHLSAFQPAELRRFLHGIDTNVAPWEDIRARLGWELLYRVEPDLYERLIAGERLHPGIVSWLPDRVASAVEVGAGTGRLTLELAARCDHLTAVEPAAAMRARLEERVPAHVRVVGGFFDELPVPSRSAALVVSCSAFTSDAGHGGERGLAEMERACERGGLVVIVWPQDVPWLVERGYEHVVFDGRMSVDFGSRDEAVELAAIFYPDALDAVARLPEGRVPYETLGISAPRDLAWRRIA